ncbi:MAG: sigma 54-interacting transcriptional regulator [Deltaproteobacteria bacterium]|nr:sigma 54-interacting transcriptional regulator [Deltaproteobacteria bacterium]
MESVRLEMGDARSPVETGVMHDLLWDAALDASRNGIIIVDTEGKILKCNKAAMRALGRPDLAPGQFHRDIVPSAWPDLKHVMETGIPQTGVRLELPHAHIIANRSPIFMDGRVVGLISVFQDISEYEAIISELKGYQELHQELAAIIEISSDGLYITDGDANTIRVNQAYERITGLKREDLIGYNMRDLVARGVFDRSVTLEVLKRREQVSIMQRVLGNKLVMVTGNPIFNEKGEIALVVTNVRDMTELNELRSKLEETQLLNVRFQEALLEQERFEHVLKDMVIKSEAMVRVVRRAVKVAGVETSVLITGESGVGKSMLARIVHQLSPRKDGPFVKINCGTIPESLMESELFGYEKGAFTGASAGGKAGLVEMAQGGTVFLDEIGDLKVDMQVKLLQVIEEKSFSRIGAMKPQSVDVRIIAATHHDLKELTDKGLFRSDLYYRLHVIPIHIPPLRERKDDIPILVQRILAKFNQSLKLKKRLAPEVVYRLMEYPFPGNVRELINIMERMIILSESQEITLSDLPMELSGSFFREGAPPENGLSLKAMLSAMESRILSRVLEESRSITEAAHRLGVHPSTLCRKMTRLRLGSFAKKQ